MFDRIVQRAGVFTASQLLELGMGRREREAAIAAGTLARVRAGWFAVRDADPEALAAVRALGCVSCASALRWHGAWVPESLGRGHVRHARHRREEGRAGCRPHGAIPPVRFAVDDVATAFRCVVRCGSAEDVVVIADSLLHLELAARAEIAGWLADAPHALIALLDRTADAESGVETMVRVRLRAHRIRVRTQVRIGDFRVDIVVGDRLVIECDGRAHHADWAAQSRDRARDLALVAAGYVVVRVTYRQVVDDWPAVEQHLLALVRRDAHRWPRRTDAH